MSIIAPATTLVKPVACTSAQLFVATPGVAPSAITGCRVSTAVGDGVVILKIGEGVVIFELSSMSILELLVLTLLLSTLDDIAGEEEGVPGACPPVVCASKSHRVVPCGALCPSPLS